MIINFNDDWKFTKPGCDPEKISLPHTWNAKDGQDGGNDYFRGTCIYEKTFSRPDGEVVYLQFPAAAMTADVTVNGKHLCHHEGGYSAFRVDITDVLADVNTVTVAVDNGANDHVYPQKADFTFYGGLYRGAKLICVPKEHFVGVPGIKVTPIVDLEKNLAVVTVETWQTAAEVTISVAGHTKTVPSYNGHAIADFVIQDVHLWDGVNDPYLYTAEAWLSSGDEVTARFGCRKIAFDAEKGFFLNGRPYALRGVSRHQDWAGVGNALTLEHHKADMDMIREIGATTVRLAHYQHAQEFYDLCDENGILAWAEIPYITAHMPNGRANTLSQMEELVTQCYNHPCIVCWGLSNEITASTPVDADMQENHRLLHDLCHRLDNTRPTTMANVFMLGIDSPILEIPDINSYNLYYGWYLGELSQNDSFFDEYHEKFPNRVIGFSEYGADANPAYQNGKPEKGDWSEPYQCVYHEHILKMIEARPWLWATHVWNLFDFGADGRDEGGKPGQNQKGLVTMDRKLRKDAFYLYKAHWSKEPFLHLCGSRYVDRTEEITEIKVYSNLPSITLLVDGAEVETQQSAKVYTFQIPISGEHTVTAVSGTLQETMTIRKVDQKNPDYVKAGGDVVNWFDREDEIAREGYYSILDSVAEIKGNPAAFSAYTELMAPLQEKAIAAYGDVAKSVKMPEAMVRQMEAMSVQATLKQMGKLVTPAFVHQLNAALNKIQK